MTPAPVGPSRWRFPPPGEWPDDDDVVCVGGDLSAPTLIHAYSSGLFPMHLGGPHDPLGWWSPLERGIFPLDGLRISRSLRRSMRRYSVTFDDAFRDVITACSEVRREGRWITGDFIDAYCGLHETGWAHSVECRDESGLLVGGLYGVRIGGFFAGESMFHRAPDASKVALVHLAGAMVADGMTLLDTQWVTPHLATLGAVAIDRDEYLVRLAAALDTGILA